MSGRQLKTRITEHKNHIGWNTTERSVVSEYRLLKHEFDWNHVEILDEEPYLGKRLVSEMLHIKKQTYSLNSQTDIESLYETYFPIINKT